MTAYAADAQAHTVAYALGGALWVVRTDEGAPFPVATAGPVTDPRPSPDGRLIAYVTGGAVHVVSLDGEDRRLAAPEGPEVTYGLSDHAAAGSMGRPRGHWWAPDGGGLLVARVDATRVQRWWICDPADPAAPPRAVRYPAAGTANPRAPPTPRCRCTFLPWTAGAPRCGGIGRPSSTCPWPAGTPTVRSSRSKAATSAPCAPSVDPTSGRTRLLHEQRDPAWVELVAGPPRRAAAGALVVTCDEQDTRRLVVDGTAVTPVGLQVREVLATQGESVLFAGGGEPTELHVWWWAPGQGCAPLSDQPGTHTAVAAGGTVVLASLVAARDLVTVLRRGTPVGRIASLAEQPVVIPRPALLRLGERALRSHLFLPSRHEPGSRKLPVLLNPYGGQQLLLVTRALGWPSCVSQWFAEQGFAVLVTDGRGCPGRGPAWEKAIRGDILSCAIQDQADALGTAAARCPDLDLERVAIRGWSFGGFLAAGAVLRRPDIFHAAVAGAPTTDQRLYNTHWKERYLGHPDQEPHNYDRCSLIADALLLRRPLLLIHGLADDNVAVAHTLRLSAALLAAGRDHRVLLLPGASHRAEQEAVAENLLHLQLDFLNKSLER